MSSVVKIFIYSTLENLLEDFLEEIVVVFWFILYCKSASELNHVTNPSYCKFQCLVYHCEFLSRLSRVHSRDFCRTAAPDCCFFKQCMPTKVIMCSIGPYTSSSELLQSEVANGATC